MNTPMGRASVYDLRHMKEVDYNWFWSTSFALLMEYIADGYDDDDLQYAYDTQDVLIELYSNIQVMS
mgnify:CR=1 FL=1|tara:strand:+ start:169 stop:369 length:201 start_codon:yes stop_codon:yes gene_type:complete